MRQRRRVRPSREVAPPPSPSARRLVLVSALLVVLASLVGALLWPWLRWALGGVALWALALALTVRFRPRWALRRPNLWAGLLVLLSAMAGLLEALFPGRGGVVGQRVWAGGGWLGPLQVSGLTLAGVALLFPRQSAWALLLLALGTGRTARLLGWAGLVLAQVLWEGATWPVRAVFLLLRGRPAPSPPPRRVTEKASAPPWQTRRLREEPPRPTPPPARNGGWALPGLDLLEKGEEAVVSEEETLEKAALIEETLAQFGIEVTVEEIRPGPTVTQFGLVPGWVRKGRDRDGRRDRAGRPPGGMEERVRVKVDAILAREKDLALALAAPSLRFEAPVPGEGFIGLEVPNSRPALVTLRSVVESEAFRSLLRKGELPIALGKGTGGEPVVADLAEMPHVLIAGSTGSGKSVCINSILCCLLLQKTPWDLRFLLVDPKRVELTPYNGIPHLVAPVVVEADRVVPLLRGLLHEMKERYKRLEEAGVRNIQSFNRRARGAEERLPYLLVVIDELADLMMASPGEVEQHLCRLAQLGRAVGIHLIVATQRPSVDVITGLIKANFPSRISFAVVSQADSRTILDGAGAEKLLGRGDMLFLPTNYLKPKRLQGVYISEEETGRIIQFWKTQQGPPPPSISLPTEEEGEAEDELLEEAKRLAGQYNRLSVSLLQRRLGIGYMRASRLLDRLEEMGVVAPGEPGKPREVLRPAEGSGPSGEE